ncbi:MAG: hypothetical protein U0457_15030 [Candidatus Sericytochromatia bacterium]
MLDMFLPKDIMFSFTDSVIFKVESIIKELEISEKDFSDFVLIFLQENYTDKNIDLLLILYEYVLQKVNFEIDELLEEDIVISTDLNYESILLDEVMVKGNNKIVSYELKKETFLKIEKLLNKIPDNEKTKTIKWFLNEINPNYSTKY